MNPFNDLMALEPLGDWAAEQAYFDDFKSRVLPKIRSASEEKQLDWLGKMDPRARALFEEHGGFHMFPGGKLVGMHQFPEMDSVKLLLEKLKAQQPGSLLEALRMLVLVAIVESLAARLEGRIT